MTILTDAFVQVIVSSIRTNRARCALYIYILYFCVCCLFFFLGGIPNIAGNDLIFRKNGQKEFQIPLANRADQVLTPHRIVFYFFQ